MMRCGFRIRDSNLAVHTMISSARLSTMSGMSTKPARQRNDAMCQNETRGGLLDHVRGRFRYLALRQIYITSALSATDCGKGHIWGIFFAVAWFTTSSKSVSCGSQTGGIVPRLLLRMLPAFVPACWYIFVRFGP